MKTLTIIFTALILIFSATQASVEKQGFFQGIWKHVPIVGSDSLKEYETPLPNGNFIEFNEKESLAIVNMEPQTAVEYVENRKRTQAPAIYIDEALREGQEKIRASKENVNYPTIPTNTQTEKSESFTVSDMVKLLEVFKESNQPVEAKSQLDVADIIAIVNSNKNSEVTSSESNVYNDTPLLVVSSALVLIVISFMFFILKTNKDQYNLRLKELESKLKAE